MSFLAHILSMKTFFKTLLLLLFMTTTVLTSCMSTKCQRKLDRLQYKCPELFTNKTVVDTVILSEMKYDTVFYLTHETDTFNVSYLRPLTIKDIQLSIPYNIVLVRKNEALYVELHDTADRVYINRVVSELTPCHRRHKTAWSVFLEYTGAFFLIVIFLFILYILFLKIKNK